MNNRLKLLYSNNRILVINYEVFLQNVVNRVLIQEKVEKHA